MRPTKALLSMLWRAGDALVLTLVSMPAAAGLAVHSRANPTASSVTSRYLLMSVPPGDCRLRDVRETLKLSIGQERVGLKSALGAALHGGAQTTDECAMCLVSYSFT